MSRVRWYAAVLLCLISVSAWAQTPALVVDVQQRAEFNGPEVTGGDAGDDLYYRIFIQNTTGDTAYDVTVTDALPLDYIDLVTCCITTGPSTGAAVLVNPSPGPFQFYWSEVAANTTVSISLRYSVKNAVAPGESWSNTASVTWAATPGGSTVGFEASDTTGPYTIPDLSVVKQIEHPSQTPIATTFFGGAYSDSTSDQNTGVGAHNASNVDLAIGEEFSYIITFTFPEGTSYEVSAIDLASPVSQAGGPENRVIELLTAQVIWTGGNLTGNLIEPVGTPYNVVDISGDGDGDLFQAFNTVVRDVLNTPDGVENDDDRFIIRVTARLDDEDAGQYNGGASDDDPAIPGNNDGNIAENKLQLQWRDQFGNQTTQNPAPGSAANNDVVEPAVTVAKATNTGGPVGIGDPVQFTLTASNTGTAPAYDWVVNDLFPTEAGSPVLAFDSIDTAASSCDDLSGYSLIQFSSTEYRLGADALLSGTSCTLVMNTIVQSAAVNNVYTNSSAVLAYASRPDSMAMDIRNYVGTGSATSTFAVDAIAPMISEATPVTSPTNDSTPNVTLNSSEAGTLQIGGSCGSPAEGAVPSGPFTITLTQPDNASPLADGSYADCTAIVTDAAGNPSNLLTLSAFVIDATPPVVAETTPVAGPTNDSTPSVVLFINEAGTLAVSGSCGSSAEGAVPSGSFAITLTQPDNATPLIDGTYSDCTVTVTDAVGNASAALTLTGFTIDTVAPVLQAFARQVPADEFTNADALTFRATFDGDVVNLDATDFVVIGSTATITAVTPVTDTRVFDLTVSGGDLAGLDGIVGLNLAGGQDIADAAGNPLATVEPAIDETYTLDNTAPLVQSFARQVPIDEFTNADTLTFRATFDGDVVNVDATDFVASGTTATVTGVVPVTGTSVFDVTVSGGDLAGLDGVVGLDLAGGQDIADVAGNPIAGTEPAVDETYTVDNTPPVLQSFTRSVPIEEFTNADTLTFQATFDGDVENVDAADFAVTGTTATVTGVAPVTGASVFDVTVSGGDLAGLDGVVGLDLAGGQDIADVAGNPIAGTEPPIDETYTLDNTAVVVTVDVLVTTDNTPPLTGTIDDAQATLELQVDGQTVVPTNNGDGTWSLADDTLAAIANGTYDVQVTATDGAGNVSTDATIDELTITPDTDGDGVDNVIEDAGPNGGDANNDGVPDADQPSVASLPTATGRGYMWLEATDCPQFRGVAAVDSATLPADPLGDPYLFGLVEFQLPCETATVAISFEQGVPTLFSNSSYRKYGPVTPGDVATTSWYDFSSNASLNGNTWTLQLEDNALGDDTGDDGVIVDVGGPAIGRPLAIPTLQPWALVLLMVALLVLARRETLAGR